MQGAVADGHLVTTNNYGDTRARFWHAANGGALRGVCAAMAKAVYQDAGRAVVTV